MTKTIILIPSRLSATRLPNKPLLKINNLSIISHVVNKAKKTNIGEVFVATENVAIAKEVEKNGGNAVITNNNHKTGTDRIFEAYQKLNLSGVEYILNLQGDEPMIDVKDIIKLNNIITNSMIEMGTLGCKINDPKKFKDKNIVKVITKSKLNENNYSEAKNFRRILNHNGEENIYQHIGIYEYKVSVLEKITNLKQTENEKKNKLEQLRAIENNININVVLAKSCPIGVDTEHDYINVKSIMEK